MATDALLWSAVTSGVVIGVSVLVGIGVPCLLWWLLYGRLVDGVVRWLNADAALKEGQLGRLFSSGPEVHLGPLKRSDADARYQPK